MNRIKESKLIILASLCIIALWVSNATGSSGAVSGEGIANLVISETTSLNFGSVVSPTSQQTVVIASSSGATATSSGAQLLNTSTVGVFTITGEPLLAYHSNFTSSSITLTSGSNSIPCSLTLSLSNSALDSGGGDTLYVGGTLTVGANQGTGAYSTTYTLSVYYD